MTSIFISTLAGPFSLAFAHSLPKLPDVGRACHPVVLSLPVGLSCLIVATVGVSVGESLHTITLLNKLYECA